MAGDHHTRARRQRLYRRFLPLAAATVGLAAVIVWAATPSSHPEPRPVSAAATTTPVSTTTTIVAPPVTTTTDVGSLPQTTTLPSGASPHFQAAMQALFTSIVEGTPATASSAFFPQSAYVQVKSVNDATVDFGQRLVGEYDLDILATHAELGTGAAGATLTSVQVPAQYAHWVPPGVCANEVGYYEVANSRVVYTEDGTTRSFGIASLISWRGEWYVVHLGAILRPGSGGVVLDPEAGVGSSAPSSTC